MSAKKRKVINLFISLFSVFYHRPFTFILLRTCFDIMRLGLWQEKEVKKRKKTLEKTNALLIKQTNFRLIFWLT